MKNKKKYLSFLGSVDETAERERLYNLTKENYPANQDKSTCDHLLSTVQNVQLLIDAAMATKTNDDSVSTQRVQNRVIDANTRYRDEVQAMYNNRKCQQIADEAANQEFLATQDVQLQKAKALSDAGSKTTKYLIYGMLGLVVLVSGVIIFKKN